MGERAPLDHRDRARVDREAGCGLVEEIRGSPVPSGAEFGQRVGEVEVVIAGTNAHMARILRQADARREVVHELVAYRLLRRVGPIEIGIAGIETGRQPADQRPWHVA